MLSYNRGLLSAATGIDRFTSDLGYPPADNHGGTATAVVWIDINGFDRAVGSAGPALHAGVEIDNLGFFLLELEDAVRTNGQTHATANTGLLVQCQNCGTINISEVLH